MHEEKGFEDLVLKNTTEDALKRFCKAMTWPPHLPKKYPDPAANAAAAVEEYFSWSKGNWGIADYLAQCTGAEIPEWIRTACLELQKLCIPPEEPEAKPADADAEPKPEPTAVS